MPTLLSARRWLWLVALAVGCAPISTFRAPLAMPPGSTNQLSVGVGGDGATGIAALPGCSVTATPPGTCYEGFSGQLWAAYRFERLELSGVFFGGSSNGLGGGAGLRDYLVDTPDFQLGVDGQLGWLWGDVGMPVGLRLLDPVWVYSRPAFIVSSAPHVQLPLGVAFRVGDGFVITPEVGILAGQRDGGLAQLSAYAGLGLALQYPLAPRPKPPGDAAPSRPAQLPPPPPPPPPVLPPPPPEARPPPPPLVPEPPPITGST